jgi:hypothetical protein
MIVPRKKPPVVENGGFAETSTCKNLIVHQEASIMGILD